MSAENQEAAKAPADAASLNNVQKLAILLLTLNAENAAQITKHLEEDELEAVAAAMTGFDLITPEMQMEVLTELTGVVVKAVTAIAGGVDPTRNILEKGIGRFKASALLGRISATPTRAAATRQLADLESVQIFNLIRNEQPQTIALVMAYLTPVKASELLLFMRPEVREQVVGRMASISPTSLEAFEKVIEVLQPRLNSKHTRVLNQVGGVKMAAQVLNSLDKTISNAILVSLEERSAELGQAIRHKMFSFEDLVRLDQAALQRIMREVEAKDLALALKAASAKVQDSLLSCISKRAAEGIREEIQFMGAVKPKDIEAAQLRIIEVARRLEAEGQVEFGDNRPKSQFQKAA